jgi:hypothetical protein
MTDISDDDIEATLESWSNWPFKFVGPHAAPADLDLLPQAWRAIALATDSAERGASALALWNDDLLTQLPQFTQVLRERLADVRVCLTDGIPALVYVVSGENLPWVTWLGYDPRSFGEQPPFWDLFPAELRKFLREVHAGFVSRDIYHYGPTRPAWMRTIAASMGNSAAIEDFDDVSDIPADQLVVIARDGGLVQYCVSPDAEPGQVVTLYEGDVDAVSFGSALDQLFLLGLDAE